LVVLGVRIVLRFAGVLALFETYFSGEDSRGDGTVLDEFSTPTRLRWVVASGPSAWDAPWRFTD
jgi:hypothetical protein